MRVHPDTLLQVLIELAEQAGFEVRLLGSPGWDDAPASSGVCRVRGRLWVVISAADPVEHRIDALAGALREHAHDWLERRFLPPAVRERLGEAI